MTLEIRRSPHMPGILLTIALAATAALPSFASEVHRFNIDSADAPAALRAFASQAQVQILVDGDKLKEQRFRAVTGEFSVDEGLRLLLADSGLKVRYVGDHSVALVSNAAVATQGGDRVDADGAGATLEEVVVSAQKVGEQRLKDVPVPVSVIDAARLAEQNKVLLRDYASTVPGLNVAQVGFGSQVLAIRGVTTSGFTLPTVGVTVDGVPYGGLLNVADPDPGDLARIEVLRGPQGTLYGANSMGGLINFITKDPSPAGYSGRVEAGLSSITGGDTGYNLRGSANIPLGEALAIRVSAYNRSEPGYVDNPVRGEDNLNDTRATGGRASLLWQLTDVFSLKLSALYDHSKADGSAEVTQGLGDLQQNYLPGIGGYERTFQAYSATAKARFGGLEFASITGYNVDYGPNSFDWSAIFGGTGPASVYSRWGVTGAPFYDLFRFKKVVQEFQLRSTANEKYEWLAGAFYSNTKLRGLEYLAAENADTGQILGKDWILDYPRHYEELAAFANLTVHFTDRFDVQLGGRESRNEERQDAFVQSGPRIGEPAAVAPPVKSKTNTFTYLITPRFKLSPDTMIYARFASGYRPGGPNTADPGLPAQYEPDETRNYEVGLKADLLDHRLSIDTSVYYIDWQDIQLQKFADLDGRRLSFTSNGSAAKSQGVELSVTAKPAADWTIAGWIAYNDAKLTEALPNPGPLFGVPGDRLPLSSKYSGSLSIDKRFPLGSAATGFVGATATYVDDRLSVFMDTAARQELPSYTQTDVRLGMNFDTWSARLFVNNVTDERGLINGGLGYIVPTGFLYIQPRTFGLSIARDF